MYCVYAHVKGLLRKNRTEECRGGDIGLEKKKRISDSSHRQGNTERKSWGEKDISSQHPMECLDCLLLRQSNDNEGVYDCKAVLFCYT